ncbi:metallophosphoesterase [Latilactobacillus sakei]|nr:metallophosphoesterase [Latilactobacillus sakei]
MVNKVVYRDSTPNKFPQDYDPAKVDSRVKLRSDSIKRKQMGVDTREAIYQGLEIGAATAGEAKEIATDTANRQDESEKKVQDTSDNVNNVLSVITENSGDSAAPEVIASRKPDGKPAFKSLGERLNNMPFIEDFNSNNIDDDYDIQGGIVAPTDLKAFKDSIDGSKFNVVLQTDIHYELFSNWKPHMNSGLRHILNAMYLQDKVNAVLFNGDNINNGGGYDDKSKAVKLIDDFSTTVLGLASGNIPVFINKGNHDNNYRDGTVWDSSQLKTPIDDVISNAEFAKWFKYNGRYGEIRNGNSAYYYKDFDEYNIRLIGLDSYDLPEKSSDGVTFDFNGRHDSIFGIRQVEWLAKALDTNKHVVITTHNPINHTLGDWDDSTMINHDLIRGLISAFITGGSGEIEGETGLVSYNFKNPGNLIGVFTGHLHKDSMAEINGANYVQTTCSAVYADFSDGHADRANFYGTAKEDVLDVIEVDVEKRAVKLRRWGYGADRNFNY